VDNQGTSRLSLASCPWLRKTLLNWNRRRFHHLRSCPKRTWINPIWVQGQHFLVKADHRRCTCVSCIKVANVTSGFLDVTRRVIGVKHTMAGYYGSRMQGLDFVQRAQPLLPSFFIALSEIGVSVVVDSIP